MRSININLPKYRVRIHLTKRAIKRGEKNLIAELKSIRKGSKLSRFFRNLFEHKNLKAILGGNLILVALVTSSFTSQASAFSFEFKPELSTLSAGAVEMTTRVGVRNPVEHFNFSQGFTSYHPAVDLAARSGEPIYPFSDGKVVAVVYEKYGYGNHVIVDHGSGLRSLYAHMVKIEVKEGQNVTTGQEIGQVGRTGRATGNHLHLEISEEGHYVNPLTILPIK